MSEEARKAEAKKEPAVVSWRGHEFKIELDYDEWSVDLLESLEEGKAVGIVRGSLGPAQWRVVKSMNLKKRDLDELTDKITAAMGFRSTGESSPSST